jgi:cell division protease FtsH
VTRYGMDEKLGLVSLESERSAFLQGPTDFAIGRRDFSEETAREVDCAVRDLVHRAFEQAVGILERHKGLVIETSERLLEKETLTGEELPEIVGVTD